MAREKQFSWETNDLLLVVSGIFVDLQAISVNPFILSNYSN